MASPSGGVKNGSPGLVYNFFVPIVISLHCYPAFIFLSHLGVNRDLVEADSIPKNVYNVFMIIPS